MFLEEIHCKTEADGLDVVEEELEEQVYDNSCYSHLCNIENTEFNCLLLCCAIINIDTKGILCKDVDWIHMAQDNVQLHALVDMVISGPSGLMKGS
jgi:hypothetical protein